MDGFRRGGEAHPLQATRKTVLGSTCVGATPPQALPPRVRLAPWEALGKPDKGKGPAWAADPS